MDSVTYYKSMLDAEEFDRLSYLPHTPALLETMREYADSPAIEWEDGSRTYAGLLEDASLLRGFFAGEDIPVGSHIGIYMRNSYDFVKTFLAVTSAGYVAVLFPPALPGATLSGGVRKYAVDYLLHDTGLTDIIAEQDIGIPARVIAECQSTVPAPADESVTKKTPAAILFSSGTSGMPKGVLLSHGALMRGTLNGCYSKYRAFYLKYLLLLPLTHVFGLIRSLLTPLQTGCTVYINQDMKNLFADLQKTQPDTLILVPSLAEMLCHFASKQGTEILGGKLKIIIAGGAPVPPSLVERGLAVGVEILPGYGLTETANLVSGNGYPKETPGSVGYPYPGQELQIVNGELWVKGDNLFTEYYNDQDETEAAFTDGWFMTGDLAEFGNDGLLYITGRKKNIIVMDTGENVSPEELEELLNEFPLVKDSLIYEGKNDLNRTILVAEILPNTEAAAAMGVTDIARGVEAAVSSLNDTLLPYKQIKKTIIRDSDFERSGNMKIVRPNEGW